MNKEYTNFIKKCKSLWFFLLSVCFFITRIAAYLQRRFYKKHSFYPVGLRQIFKNSKIKLKLTQYGYQSADFSFSQAEFDKRFQLILLDEKVNFFGDDTWQSTFNDPEKNYALHRWGYLLLWVSEHSQDDTLRESGEALIMSWCNTMMRKVEGDAWESYSTGERICNAILFFAYFSPDKNKLPDIPQMLKPALLFHATHLVKNIEYYEKQATGNHVLNNARALYLAGQVLKEAAFSEMARAIFKSDLTTMIDEEGFLREGSSHYQFLVTRWLLEVFWLAKLTGDHALITLLKSKLSKMVQCCWFFLVYDESEDRWTIPLIGDVSPDFSWQWLIDLPWSALALDCYSPLNLPKAPNVLGWRKLFTSHLKEAQLSATLKHESIKWQIFSKNGWYRLDMEGFTLFCHVEPQGAPVHASHGHCDIGAFCLYYQGEEIFIDTGRLNYQLNDERGLAALSASAHNGVTIDGFDPFIYHQRSRFPLFYRLGNVNVEWRTDGGDGYLSIEHDGFSRLSSKKIIFKREFTVQKNQLHIKDTFFGVLSHQIKGYFQFSPIATVARTSARNTFSVQAKKFKGKFNYFSNKEMDLKADLFSGETSSPFFGWYSAAYGRKQSITTLQLACSTALPVSFNYYLMQEKI